MRITKHIPRFFLAAVCLGFTAGCVGSGTGYALKSESAIKAELLHDNPLGSSSASVRTYLRRKTGEEPLYDTNIMTFDGKPEVNKPLAWKERYFHGVIYCTIANYSDVLSMLMLVSAEVQTRWEFDAKDRLIDLKVTKQAVGP